MGLEDPQMILMCFFFVYVCWSYAAGSGKLKTSEDLCFGANPGNVPDLGAWGSS
jgi:hypothetical protein